MAMNDMKERCDILSQNAKTKSGQAAAYNMKSAIIGTVEAVNGLMASDVMKSEMPTSAMSKTYQSASKVLEMALKKSAQKLHIHTT